MRAGRTLTLAALLGVVAVSVSLPGSLGSKLTTPPAAALTTDPYYLQDYAPELWELIANGEQNGSAYQGALEEAYTIASGTGGEAATAQSITEAYGALATDETVAAVPRFSAIAASLSETGGLVLGGVTIGVGAAVLIDWSTGGHVRHAVMHWLGGGNGPLISHDPFDPSGYYPTSVNFKYGANIGPNGEPGYKVQWSSPPYAGWTNGSLVLDPTKPYFTSASSDDKYYCLGAPFGTSNCAQKMDAFMVNAWTLIGASPSQRVPSNDGFRCTWNVVSQVISGCSYGYIPLGAIKGVSPIRVEPYTGQDVSTEVNLGNAGTTTPTDVQLTRLRHLIDLQSQAFRDWINHELDPVGHPTNPIPFNPAPNCHGLTVAACESAIGAAGFLGSYTVQDAASNDPAIAVGRVVQTVPAVGDSLPSSPSAVVVIKTNPAKATLTMPQCIGQTWDQCYFLMRSYGWTGTRTNTVSDVFVPTYAPGAVVDITPGFGATIDTDAVIATVTNPFPAAGNIEGWYYDGGTQIKLGRVTVPAGADQANISCEGGPNMNAYLVGDGSYGLERDVTPGEVIDLGGTLYSVSDGDIIDCWYSFGHPSPDGFEEFNVDPVTVAAPYERPAQFKVGVAQSGGTLDVAGGTLAGPGGCDCTIDPVVIPPFQPDVCNKFPFGIFCWFADQLQATVGADPIPPAVTWPDITLHAPVFGAFVLPGFTLDARDLPPPFAMFIAVMRAAFGFFVWLLGLWFVGPRLLGLRGVIGSHNGEE